MTNDIAIKAAEILLKTESVLLSPDNPFTLTNGKKSPVYVDCRKLIAFPKERQQIIKMATEILAKYEFDAVAGGETAGIPYAAWLAEAMNKPMAYIRKKPKGFGKNARIEGDIKAGQNTLLVEDLATDGGSKISFVEAIREADALCQHCFVVFYYGIFASAEKTFKEHNFELHYLSRWSDILQVAEAQNLLPADKLSQVKFFLKSPEEWRKFYQNSFNIPFPISEQFPANNHSPANNPHPTKKEKPEKLPLFG